MQLPLYIGEIKRWDESLKILGMGVGFHNSQKGNNHQFRLKLYRKHPRLDHYH